MKEYNLHLSQILDSLFIFVGLCKSDGTLIEANKAALEAAGIQLEDVLNKPFEETYWWSYDKDVQKKLKESIGLAKQGVSSRYDVYVRVSDENIIPIDFQLVPIRNTEGDVIYIVPSAIDISERVEIEKSLIESEIKYRETFENAAVGIAHVGFDGKWLNVNNRLCEIVGYSKEELLNKTFQALTHPDDLEADLDLFYPLIKNKIKSYQIEKRYIHKNGHIIWINLTSAVQCDKQNNPIYCISIIQDITDKKEAEKSLNVREKQLQDLTRSLEEMVELRTLKLHRQSKRLRWLNRQLINVEQRERKRLAGLIHDHLQQLLVASRINLKRLENVNYNEKQLKSLNNAIKLLDEGIAAGRNLTSELRPPMIYEAGLNPALLWLIQQMQQHYNLNININEMDECNDINEDLKLTLYDSVRELFFNVHKHAYVQEAEFTLLKRDNSITASVSDKGRGFNVKNIYSHRSDQMNFGLFNIQERIESLDGSINIDSSPNYGTIVELCLPLNEYSDDAVCENKLQIINTLNSDLNKQKLDDLIRILLVDDHKIVREGIAGIIEEVPNFHIVGQADDGSEAITKVDHLNPDVVIMDVNMPRMNGIDATRQISQRWKNVSVIGLSIQGEDSTAETMMKAGAVNYFYKGGDPDELISAIISAADVKRNVPTKEQFLD